MLYIAMKENNLLSACTENYIAPKVSFNTHPLRKKV